MTIRELMHWNRPFNLPVNQRDRRGQSLFSLQDDMNHLLQSFFSDNGYSQWDEGFSANMPAIDLIENERDFKVKAEVAGYNPDDIDVSVTDGFLTLSGERQDKTKKKTKTICAVKHLTGLFNAQSPCRRQQIARRLRRPLKMVF
jgi:HSP20 family molecular chaperone IbpA